MAIDSSSSNSHAFSIVTDSGSVRIVLAVWMRARNKIVRPRAREPFPNAKHCQYKTARPVAGEHEKTDMPPSGEKEDPRDPEPPAIGDVMAGGNAEVAARLPAATGKPLSWISKFLRLLGPGIVTGAADDDPSGIATYSQVGAQFGYDLGWTLIFSYPLMSAIQQISARIGRVTGLGLAGNLRRHFPAPALYMIVLLLLVANIINLGADLGAMAEALRLLMGGSQIVFVILVA